MVRNALYGPVIPFGAMAEYHPISAEDLSRLHQFGAKVLPGKFRGYAVKAVRIWKGDILIAEIEELKQMDASEIHARRLNSREVLTPMKGEKFIFPVADGTVKISGGYRRPEYLQGESHWSSSTPRQNSAWHAGEAINDFWSMSGKTSFTVITWNPESNCTCREKIHFMFR